MNAAATWEDIQSVFPMPDNPRKNAEAVQPVADSIKRFGFGAPLVARKSDRVLIAGHTRLQAAQLLGLDKVPVRFVDLDPAEARALALADNRLGEIATWDDEQLREVIAGLESDGVDLAGIGWSDDELSALLEEATPPSLDDDTYTTKVQAPIYEPTGECPPVSALVDETKTSDLLAEIDAADIPPPVASFLRAAAQRHTVFHFRNIAEFYCHASPDVQDLMERSALVIIDYDKAVEYGFVHLTERLASLAAQEQDAANAG